jgi:PAB-dependent poly(A)-specific ribonuclease subunit 3
VLDLSWDTSVHAQIQPADELTVMALSEQTWVPEPVMWSYISQLLSTLKAIHLVGLAARVYDASNILLTSKNRVRVSCTGIFDVLGLESTKPIQQLQQEDMIHFGQLLLTIACRSLAAVHNLPRSLELVSRRYSADFRRVLIYLLSRPNPLKQLDEVASMCGSRLLYELDAANLYNDYLENELVRELENGRIIRLFSKLGFINERPEFDMDPKWSETGDRYLLKLFRDYVFHQVDQQGKPVIDLVHVLTCLNKLDAGIDEKVMLVSRDERSCLVVSFKELKACVDNAFSDLSRGFSA